MNESDKVRYYKKAERLEEENDKLWDLIERLLFVIKKERQVSSEIIDEVEFQLGSRQ